MLRNLFLNNILLFHMQTIKKCQGIIQADNEAVFGESNTLTIPYQVEIIVLFYLWVLFL